jgi:hypothetical protein
MSDYTNESEAERFILENISVTWQRLAVMKGLLIKHFQPYTLQMLDNALRELNAVRPTNVVLHTNVDVAAQLKQVVDWLSWSLTGTEAIWSLIHSGVLIQTSTSLHNFSPSIGWTTVVPGSGGTSSGWQFDKLGAVFPSQVALSRIHDGNDMLSHPDLYLNELAIPRLHPEIEDSIREAVRCFRAELYTACVVMLGKASEGTWIELGVALVNTMPESESGKLEKFREDLIGHNAGFAKKLRDVLKLYETRQDVFKTIGQRSGVTLDDLRVAMIWADTLRDSRNVIHHRTEPSMSQTYETVTTLLLCAAPHLRNLYRLYESALGETATGSHS